MKKLISVLLIIFSLTMLLQNSSVAGMGQGPDFGEIALYVLGAAIVAGLIAGLVIQPLANWGLSNNHIVQAQYQNPSWLPDGRIICTKLKDIYVYEINQDIKTKKINKVYTITVMNADGTGENDVRDIDAATLGGDIAASPDGRYIAIASGGSIKVFKADFSDYITITPSNNNNQDNALDSEPVYHEDKFVNPNTDKQFNVSDISTTLNAHLTSVPNADWRICSLDFSPEYYGYKLVYTNSDKQLRITSISSNIDSFLSASAEAVAWRIGDKIVYTSGTSGFNVLTPEGKYLYSITSVANNAKDIDKNFQIANDQSIVYLGKDNDLYSIKPDHSPNTKLILSDCRFSAFKLSFDNKKILGSIMPADETSPQIFVTDISSGKTIKLR